MVELLISSMPSGAEVQIDGEIVGTTPLTLPIGEVSVPIDMAVFVSPQYKDDVAILSAIQTYADAVKADIGWNVVTVKVGDMQNRYDKIDTIIKDMYWRNPMKACLMVGEDMAENKNVFHTSVNKKCEQSRVPWCTFSGYSTVSSCDTKVISSQIKIDIPISLLYPNAYDAYTTKKTQLISVFAKFSENREMIYPDNVLAICDDQQIFYVPLENELPTLGNASVHIEPTQAEVDGYTLCDYKFFAASAHARPSFVDVNPGIAHFRVDHAENLNTPFLHLDGCGTSHWWTELSNDCLYQKQYATLNWFGHTIIDNPNLRVILSRFPTGGYDVPYGFICSKCLERMNNGMTVAESMIGITSYGSDVSMFGDPTFHY